MKKFLILATSAFVISAVPALAEDGAAPGKGEHHKGGMMNQSDTNADGIVSKAEFMANSEKMFANMDINGDGNITKDEMEAKKAEWRKKIEEMKAVRQKAKKEAPATDSTPDKAE